MYTHTLEFVHPPHFKRGYFNVSGADHFYILVLQVKDWQPRGERSDYLFNIKLTLDNEKSKNSVISYRHTL